MEVRVIHDHPPADAAKYPELSGVTIYDLAGNPIARITGPAARTIGEFLEHPWK